MSDALTPTALAEVIGVNPKVLRSYLRKVHTRPTDVKGTTWIIDADVADAAIAHFEAQRAAKATPAPEVEAEVEAPVEA